MRVSLNVKPARIDRSARNEQPYHPFISFASRACRFGLAASSDAPDSCIRRSQHRRWNKPDRKCIGGDERPYRRQHDRSSPYALPGAGTVAPDRILNHRWAVRKPEKLREHGPDRTLTRRTTIRATNACAIRPDTTHIQSTSQGQILAAAIQSSASWMPSRFSKRMRNGPKPADQRHPKGECEIRGAPMDDDKLYLENRMLRSPLWVSPLICALFVRQNHTTKKSLLIASMGILSGIRAPPSLADDSNEKNLYSPMIPGWERAFPAETGHKIGKRKI